MTKAAQDALESTGDRALLFELLSLYDQRAPLRERPELWERVRAALQDKAGEVPVVVEVQDLASGEWRLAHSTPFWTKDQAQQAASCLKAVTRVRPFAAQPAPVVPDGLLAWAVDRWRDEVRNRPLINKNRRTLDDTWRQVVRFAGGDPEKLLGPSHDELLAQSPTAEDKP